MKSNMLLLSHFGSRKYTALWLLWLALVVTASAQLIPTGSILGTVKDPGGALVPNVAITATNLATGVARSTKSNAAGEFLLDDLLPGTYRVEAAVQGFQKFAQPATVQSIKSVTLDITLQLGTSKQTVEVTAEAALLQTTSGSLSSVVTNRQVLDLPLLGRNALMLEYLSPGIVDTHSTGGSGVGGYGVGSSLDVNGMGAASYFSSNGAGWRTNEFMLDGVPDNLTDRVQYLPPPDQVQEINVITNAFDAQYGHGGGATVVMVTKTGTNGWHGDAYEFLQNSVFNASGFFANMNHVKKPVSRFNQFGGTIGGPIRKNKTFFFFNYEGSRTSTGSVGITTVLTAQQRTGDFSQTFDANNHPIQIYNPFTTAPDPNNPGQYIRTQFAGNVISSALINSASKGLLALMPLPNAAGAAFTGANNYVNVTDTSTPYNDYSIRVDHQISQNHRLFGRYSRERTGSYTTAFFPAEPPAFSYTWQVSVGLGYTWLISPTTVLDAFLGAEGYHGDGVNPKFSITNYGFSSSFASIRPQSTLPSISASDMAGLGYGRDSYDHDPTWAFNANIRHTRGRQNMKWGFNTQFKQDNSGNAGTADSFSFTRGFTQGPNPVTVGTNIGYGDASFLLGTMTNSSIDQSPGSEATTAPYYGGYFQDDIRVTSKLTVNAGLRWEVWQKATERWNRLNVGFAYGVPNPIQAQAQANYAAMEPASIQSLLSASQFGAGVTGGLLFGTPSNRRWGKTYWDDWEPRIGVAYRLTPKTVLRAGFGVYHTQFWTDFTRQNGFTTNTTAVGTVDGITPTNLLNNPFPTGFVAPTGSSLGLETLLGQSFGYLNQFSQPGQDSRWNIGFQREIAPQTIFEAYYVGATDFHLPIGSNGQIFTPAGNAEQDAALVYLPAKYLSQGSALYNLVPNPFQGLIPSGAEAGATISEGQLLAHYPEFTGLDDARQTDGRSYYHSLQATVTHRYSNGLSLLSSWTWSKQVDRYRYINASDPGPSKMIGYFDAPQRFTLGYVYELPVGPDRRWGWKSGARGKLIGGWQWGVNGDFQSGLPIPMAGQILTGVNPTLSPSARNRLDWFNKAAMIPLPAFTLSNTPWTLEYLRADADENWNMAFIKNTMIHETVKVQFRWEMFNTFNHVQFGNPDTNPVSATYGQIFSQQNGPRQMQVALKIIF